jgi:hypothetical protein
MSLLPSFSLPSIAIPTALQVLGAPASQKAGDRPISFSLDDLATGTLNTIALNIRPEELTRTQVSRLTVQQTLGGAWADDFGAGLTTINISGHTGWRGSFSGGDGMDLFAALRAQVFDNWHILRNQARANGVDPRFVQLVFADALDSTVDVVAPISFTLRRSKSRPLLMQYQISMIALGDIPPPAPLGFLDSLIQALGLSSVIAAISSIVSTIKAVVGFVESNIIGPIVAFMGLAVSVFNTAVAIIETPAALVSLVLGVATSVAQVGVNIFGTLGAVVSNSTNVTANLMAVTGAFSDIFCVLKNSIAQAKTYPIYTGLYGASNCSSTVPGASPASQYTLSGVNPFYDVVGTATTPPVSVSVAAQVAIDTIIYTDPVLSPLTPAQLAALITTITNGISITA